MMGYMAARTQHDAAILVMNQSDRNGKLATSLLEKVGLEVFNTSNGREAVELVRASDQGDQSVRLVIIDEAAASERGVPELVENLRAADAGVRIILVSEDDAKGEPSARTSLNIRGCLKKPFRRAQFLGSVLRVIGEPKVRTA